MNGDKREKSRRNVGKSDNGEREILEKLNQSRRRGTCQETLRERAEGMELNTRGGSAGIAEEIERKRGESTKIVEKIEREIEVKEKRIRGREFT